MSAEKNPIFVCQAACQGTYRREAFRKIFYKRFLVYFVPLMTACLVCVAVFLRYQWVQPLVLGLWITAMALAQSHVNAKIDRGFEKLPENNRKIYAVLYGGCLCIESPQGHAAACYEYKDFCSVYQTERLLILYGKKRVLLMKRNGFSGGTPRDAMLYLRKKLENEAMKKRGSDLLPLFLYRTLLRLCRCSPAHAPSYAIPFP